MGQKKAYQPYPIEWDRVANKQYHPIRCDCGATEKISTAPSKGLPVNVISRKFGQHGWTMDLKNHGHGTCPACQEKARKPRPTLSLVRPTPITDFVKASQEEPVAALSPKQAAQEIVKAAAAEPPKTMGLDEMLLVLELVEDNYDPKTGYKDGYSDAVVAAELTCPVDWVRQVRTKKFGNLPETPAMTELRRDIQAAERRLEETRTLLVSESRIIDRKIDELKERRDAMVSNSERHIDLCKGQLRGLTDRLEALTRG